MAQGTGVMISVSFFSVTSLCCQSRLPEVHGSGSQLPSSLSQNFAARLDLCTPLCKFLWSVADITRQSHEHGPQGAAGVKQTVKPSCTSINANMLGFASP